MGRKYLTSQITALLLIWLTSLFLGADPNFFSWEKREILAGIFFSLLGGLYIFYMRITA